MIHLWNEYDLSLAASGLNLELSTMLMNKTTFLANEIQAYNAMRQNVPILAYVARWNDSEPVAFHAPNDTMAFWWLGKEYNQNPDSLTEIITTRREVPLPA